MEPGVPFIVPISPNRFCSEHLGIKLKKFQEVTLCEMFKAPHAFFLGCRGISKTWLTALFASVKCILYPHTECIVVSATRRQGKDLVKKIRDDFMPNYPMFALEVESISNNQTETIVKFRSQSSITVATASESSRGMRSNLLIVDEARLIKKSILESILKKTMTAPRHAGFMDLPEYESYDIEPNQEIYLTSAWYQSHWIYNLFRDYAAAMIMDKPFFAIALPYQLAIKERLLDRRQVESDMMSSDFNEISWIMEMCAEFWSGADGALYSYDDIVPNRIIKYAFYPPKVARLISDKRLRIPPKMHNEIRIVSADIALMQSNSRTSNNDATSVHVNQLLLNDHGGHGIKNIVYSENFEGLRAEEQALAIRRIVQAYDADWLIIDTRGLGLPVVDLIMSDMYDQETGETYCALGCYNNPDIDARCTVRGAPKKIWAMNANADINSQCALLLREEFRQNNIHLLSDEEDFDDNFGAFPNFSKLSLEDKLKLKMPYINTGLMINELINLETEVKGIYVKVKEKSGYRKDRFSSLSYNIWLSNKLEKEHEEKLAKKDFSSYIFEFRKPKISR